MANILSLFLLLTRFFRVSGQAALAVCLVMMGVLVVSSTSTRAASDADSRLRQLEGSIDTLNRAVFDGKKPVSLTGNSLGASPSPSMTSDYQASVESRLSDLEQQLREMTGKVEQLTYDNQQLKSNLDKALSDLDVRLQEKSQATVPPTNASESSYPSKQSGTLGTNDMGGEVNTPSMPSGSALAEPPPSSPHDSMQDYNAPASQDSPTVKTLGEMVESPGGASIPPKSSEDAAGLYESSFSTLKAGNYMSAKNGFEQFLKKFPDHPLASNATYWLGESYYAQGEYTKSARIFAESYKKYPKGPKAADSLLKMGMSLGGAGKKMEACVTLGQLKKEFPSGDAVTLRRADQEMERLDCES